jgi:DNA-binding XRE family transcriptional regulator
MTPKKSKNLLKKTRKENKLNQIDMANLLRITQSTLSKIESGKQDMNLETWFLFCEKFGVKKT